MCSKHRYAWSFSPLGPSSPTSARRGLGVKVADFRIGALTLRDRAKRAFLVPRGREDLWNQFLGVLLQFFSELLGHVPMKFFFQKNSGNFTPKIVFTEKKVRKHFFVVYNFFKIVTLNSGQIFCQKRNLRH